MNLVSCPRCGSQFDVSSFAPGANFVCGTCKNLLQVPTAPVVAPVVKPIVQPVAKPVAPPAAKPVAQPTAKPVAQPAAKPVARPMAPPVAKAPAPAATAPASTPEAPAAAPAALAKKPGMDKRRAGDAAAGGAEAPTEGRSERIRRQRAEGGDAPKKKNALPLLLGAVGGVVIVGIGIVFAMKSGDKKPGQAGETGPKPAVVDATPKSYEQLDAPKQIAERESRHKEAKASAAAVKEGVEWFRSKSLTEDAKQVLDDGRKLYPADPWINAELGLKDRSADLKSVLDDEMVTEAVDEADPDLKFVRDYADRVKKDKTAAWISKDDSDRLDKAVAALKEAATKLSDPVYQRTKQYYDNVRLNPTFTDMEFAFRGDYRPYVIFAESPGPDRMAKAEEVVNRTGKAITWVYREWLRFMKEELKMDPPTLESLKDERLKVFVFKSRESFDAWHTRNKIGSQGASVAAYYEHGRERMIMMHLDAFDPSVIMHEATHQLIHFYARHFCEKDDAAEDIKAGKKPESVSYEDHRLNSSFFWFQEGIAEYFGAAGLGRTEAEWKLGRLQKGRMAFFAFMRGQKKTWPVEDFLFSDQSQIRTHASVMGGGDGMGDELWGLMYSQGWTLVHYFLHGENGKYRERFLEMIRNELKGVSAKPYLLEAFGLKDASGRSLKGDDPKVKAFMAEIQTGYMKYFDELMKKIGSDE